MLSKGKVWDSYIMHTCIKVSKSWGWEKAFCAGFKMADGANRKVVK